MKKLRKVLFLAVCLNALIRSSDTSPVKGAGSSIIKPPSRPPSVDSTERTANIKGASKVQTNTGSSQSESGIIQTRVDRNSVDTVQTTSHSGGYDFLNNNEPVFGILPADGETKVSEQGFHQTDVQEHSFSIDTRSQEFQSTAREVSSACDLVSGDCSYTVRTSSHDGGTPGSKGSPHEPIIKNPSVTGTQDTRITSTHQQVPDFPLNQQVADFSLNQQVADFPLNQQIADFPLNQQVADFPLNPQVADLPFNKQTGSANQGSVVKDSAFQVDSPADLSVNVPSSRSSLSAHGGGGLRTNDIQSMNDHHHHHHHSDNPIDWLREGIPGEPGSDYPIFYQVPLTSFECKQQQFPAGIYGDMDTQCQAFHICQRNGRQDSFLCPNGTVFNQQYFVCDWWYNYQCSDTLGFYALNEDIYQNIDDSSVSEVIRGMVSDKFVNTNRRTFVDQNFPDSSINSFSNKVEQKSQRVSSQRRNESPISSSSSSGTTQLRNAQPDARSDNIRDKSFSTTRVSFSPSLPVQLDDNSGYADTLQDTRPLPSKSNAIINQQPKTDKKQFSLDNTQRQQTGIDDFDYTGDKDGQRVVGTNIDLVSDELYQQQQNADIDFDRGSQRQEFIDDFGSSQYEDRNDQETIPVVSREAHSQQVLDDVSLDHFQEVTRQEKVDNQPQSNVQAVSREDHSQQVLDGDVSLDQFQEVTRQQAVDSQPQSFSGNSDRSFVSRGSVSQKSTDFTFPQHDHQTSSLFVANRQDNFQRTKGSRLSSAINRQDQILLHDNQGITQKPQIKPNSRLNSNGPSAISVTRVKGGQRGGQFGQREQSLIQTRTPTIREDDYLKMAIDTRDSLNQAQKLPSLSQFNNSPKSEIVAQSDFQGADEEQGIDRNIKFDQPATNPTSTGSSLSSTANVQNSPVSRHRILFSSPESTDVRSKNQNIKVPISPGSDTSSFVNARNPSVSRNRMILSRPESTLVKNQSEQQRISDETYFLQNIEEDFRRIQPSVNAFNGQRILDESRTESVSPKESDVTQQQVAIDDSTVISDDTSFASQEKIDQIEVSTFGPFPAIDQLNKENQVDVQTTDGEIMQFSTTETGTGFEENTDNQQRSHDTSDVPTDTSTLDDATFPQEQTEQQPTDFNFPTSTQDENFQTVQNSQPVTENEQKPVDDTENPDCDVTDSPNTFTEPSQSSYPDQPIYGSQPDVQTPNTQQKQFNNGEERKLNRPVEPQPFKINQGGFKPISDERRIASNRGRPSKTNYPPTNNRDANNQYPSPNYQNNHQYDFHHDVRQNFQPNFNIPNRHPIPGPGDIMGVIIRQAHDGAQNGGNRQYNGPGPTMLFIQPQMMDYPRGQDFSTYQRKQVMPLRRLNENNVQHVDNVWQGNQGFLPRDNGYQNMHHNYRQNVNYPEQRNYRNNLANDQERYPRPEYHRQEFPNYDRSNIDSDFVQHQGRNQEYGRHEKYDQQYNNNQQRFNNYQQIPDQGYEDHRTPPPDEQEQYNRPEQPPQPQPPPPHPEERPADDRLNLDRRGFPSQVPPDSQRIPIIQSAIPINVDPPNVKTINPDRSIQQSNPDQNINFNNPIVNEGSHSTQPPFQFNSDDQRNADIPGNNYNDNNNDNNGPGHQQSNLPNFDSQEEYSQEASTSTSPQLNSWVGSDSWKPVISNSQGTYRKQNNGQYIKV